MGSWRYSALDAAGSSARGVIEAASEANAVDALIARKLTPVRLESTESASNRLPLARLADRVAILRHLAILFEARVPAAEALKVAASMAPKAHQQRLSVAAEVLKSGGGLSAALQNGGLLDEENFAGVAAGEAAGQLPEALSRLADGLSKSSALRGEILSAALYPVILLVALFGTLAVMFGAVLPVLIPVFKERATELPFATRALIGLHAFWQSSGILVVIVLAALGATTFMWARSLSGRVLLHRAMIRSRLWLGVPKLIAGASLARTLSMLLGGGMPLVPALERAAAAQRNDYARAAVSEAVTQVRGGARLGAALRSIDAFPASVIELLRIGEETGRLAVLCGEAAELMDQQVRARLKRVTVLFTPLATLILGGLIAFLMTGIVGGIMASSAPAAGL